MNRLYKIIAISFLVSAGYGTSLAQSVNGLAIGSKIPDLKIEGPIINGSPKATVSDLYKKGGLIINFWATWCAPCRREQKLLDSLMQIYPDLSVISTSYEDSLTVRKHFDKIGLPKSKSMIINSNDTVFHNAFRHRIIPHNIWINKDGIIKAITGGDEVTEKHVKKFLEGNISKLYMKEDDLKFSMFKTYHVPDSMILFRSYITGYNERIISGSSYGADKNGEFKNLVFWNRPIVELFWMAYTHQKNNRMNWNLIELKSSDSTRFILPQVNRPLFERSRYANGDDFITRSRKWKKDNLYCYELILPKSIPVSKAPEYMFPDLEKVFNVKASVRRKRIMTNVVSLDQSKLGKLPVSKGGKPRIHKYSDSFIVNDKSIDIILNFLLQSFTDDVPYIDKTGYKGKLSFEVVSKSEQLTLAEVWAKLNEFGIVKVEKKRSYPVLVINDLCHPLNN